MKKGKVFGKGQIAVAVMVLALGAAIWLNAKYLPSEAKYLGEASYVSNSSEEEAVETSAKPQEDYFTKAKKEREAARKEAVETKNMAESLIFQCEKTMTDAGDKLTDADKQPVNDAIATLKASAATDDIEKIKADIDALQKAIYEVSAKLYQQANPNGDQGAGFAPNAGGFDPNAGNNGNDYYDADFTDKSNN